MEKKAQAMFLIIIAVLLIVVIVVLLAIFRFPSEDSWIKDSRGVYIKHGNPYAIPDYVNEQKDAISCALNKLNNFSGEVNSQCLGNCGDFAVDVVHVPRNTEDDKMGNQCEDFKGGKVKHFIEIDYLGNIVRIV